MTTRMNYKQAQSLFKVEVKKAKRRPGEPVRPPWNSLSLDAPARKGRFAVSEASARTADGIVFASKLEASRYHHLKLLVRIGEISELAVQPEWNVDIGGKHFCRYRADFAYFCSRRQRLIIEDVKSTGTQKDAAYKLRKKAAELAHGISVLEVTP